MLPVDRFETRALFRIRNLACSSPSTRNTVVYAVMQPGLQLRGFHTPGAEDFSDVAGQLLSMGPLGLLAGIHPFHSRFVCAAAVMNKISTAETLTQLRGLLPIDSQPLSITCPRSRHSQGSISPGGSLLPTHHAMMVFISWEGVER